MLPGHGTNLPSPGRTTKYWGKTSQTPARAVFYLKKRPNERGWRRFVSALGTYAPGIYAAKLLEGDGKITKQKQKEKEKNKFLLVLAFSTVLEEIMEQIGSIYTNRRRLGFVWVFFFTGFMLNLLVAGVSRDRAGAERELISLCRKTIIRLIEPPGSETLQPEMPALAEQAERAGDDP